MVLQRILIRSVATKATMTICVMGRWLNGYIIPFKTFMSKPTDLPLTRGNFRTYVKYRWKIMHDNIFAGSFQDLRTVTLFTATTMIRVIQRTRDPATYNYMDDARSDGCLKRTLSQVMPAWIYYNRWEHLYNRIHWPVEKDSYRAADTCFSTLTRQTR